MLFEWLLLGQCVLRIGDYEGVSVKLFLRGYERVSV